MPSCLIKKPQSTMVMPCWLADVHLTTNANYKTYKLTIITDFGCRGNSTRLWTLHPPLSKVITDDDPSPIWRLFNHPVRSLPLAMVRSTTGVKSLNWHGFLSALHAQNNLARRLMTTCPLDDPPGLYGSSEI